MRNLLSRIERLEQQTQGLGARAVWLLVGDRAKPLTGYAVGKPTRSLENHSDGAEIVKRNARESEEALLQRALDTARLAMPDDAILKLSELRGPELSEDFHGWSAWRI